jgi:hypothetical protein
MGNLEGVLHEIQRALRPTPEPQERASLVSPSPQGGGETRQRKPRRPRKERS